MGNYEELKQAVADVIKSNGNQEITGAVFQNVLLTIISTIGNGATFAGIATPTTNPGTPDQNVFYIASQDGTYSNFGGVTLNGEVVIFTNKKGNWVKTDTGIATKAKLTEVENELQNNSNEIFIKVGTIPIITNTGWYSSDGILHTEKGKYTNINVKSGDTFNYKGSYGGACVGYIIYDNNKERMN